MRQHYHDLPTSWTLLFTIPFVHSFDAQAVMFKITPFDYYILETLLLWRTTFLRRDDYAWRAGLLFLVSFV